MGDRPEDHQVQVRAVLGETLRGLGHLDRAKQLSDLINFLNDVTSEYSHLRREDLEELLRQGHKQAELARALGISTARMSKLIKTAPPPERSFFGTGTKPLTVAVGQKLEGGKERPGSVVAEEDVLAYEQLRKLAESMGLRTQHEVIRPPGTVNLNRDNLVIICGPRLCPLIGQILESDRRYGFEKDEAGWYLTDRETGKSYRSPEDSGDAGDLAYLGRLPRPDGKGDFIYIAGIHAAGAGGAVNYLAHNLAELYQQVRTKRFSVLVSCEYDPHTRVVSGSKLITPIHRQES